MVKGREQNFLLFVTTEEKAGKMILQTGNDIKSLMKVKAMLRGSKSYYKTNAENICTMIDRKGLQETYEQLTDKISTNILSLNMLAKKKGRGFLYNESHKSLAEKENIINEYLEVRDTLLSKAL